MSLHLAISLGLFLVDLLSALLMLWQVSMHKAPRLQLWLCSFLILIMCGLVTLAALQWCRTIGRSSPFGALHPLIDYRRRNFRAAAPRPELRRIGRSTRLRGTLTGATASAYSLIRPQFEFLRRAHSRTSAQLESSSRSCWGASTSRVKQLFLLARGGFPVLNLALALGYASAC